MVLGWMESFHSKGAAHGERLVDVIPYGVECLDEASNVDVAVVLKKKGNVNREARRVSRVLKDIMSLLFFQSVDLVRCSSRTEDGLIK